MVPPSSPVRPAPPSFAVPWVVNDGPGSVLLGWTQGVDQHARRYVEQTNDWRHYYHAGELLMDSASDKTGNVVGVWQHYDPSGNRLGVAVTRFRAAEWDPEVTLAVGPQPGCSPAVNKAGNAVVVCSATENGHRVVRATSSASGGTWTPLALITETGEPSVSDVVIDDSGSATVIWNQASDLWSARLE